jgi:hypothetical protein
MKKDLCVKKSSIVEKTIYLSYKYILLLTTGAREVTSCLDVVFRADRIGHSTVLNILYNSL